MWFCQAVCDSYIKQKYTLQGKIKAFSLSLLWLFKTKKITDITCLHTRSFQIKSPRLINQQLTQQVLSGRFLSPWPSCRRPWSRQTPPLAWRRALCSWWSSESSPSLWSRPRRWWWWVWSSCPPCVSQNQHLKEITELLLRRTLMNWCTSVSSLRMNVPLAGGQKSLICPLRLLKASLCCPNLQRVLQTSQQPVDPRLPAWARTSTYNQSFVGVEQSTAHQLPLINVRFVWSFSSLFLDRWAGKKTSATSASFCLMLGCVGLCVSVQTPHWSIDRTARG